MDTLCPYCKTVIMSDNDKISHFAVGQCPALDYAIGPAPIVRTPRGNKPGYASKYRRCSWDGCNRRLTHPGFCHRHNAEYRSMHAGGE